MSYTLNRFNPQDPSYPRIKRGRYNEGRRIEVSKFHRVTLHSRFDPLLHKTEHFQPFSYYGRYLRPAPLVEPVIEPPPMTEEQQRVAEVGYHQLLQTEARGCRLRWPISVFRTHLLACSLRRQSP